MPLYMSADERREVIRDYADEYTLDVLIETGTNAGDTPWALKDEFSRIYTIELDDKLYAQAKARFQNTRHIQVIHGDSAARLPEVLQMANESSLLWLDGHCSGPGTARGEFDTPIRQELEVLFADPKKHCILIDDARIFDGQPEHGDEPHYGDYPTVEWVETLAKKHDYEYELKDDIIRLVPERWIELKYEAMDILDRVDSETL